MHEKAFYMPLDMTTEFDWPSIMGFVLKPELVQAKSLSAR